MLNSELRFLALTNVEICSSAGNSESGIVTGKLFQKRSSVTHWQEPTSEEVVEKAGAKPRPSPFMATLSLATLQMRLKA